jgi:hypothetical protein
MAQFLLITLTVLTRLDQARARRSPVVEPGQGEQAVPASASPCPTLCSGNRANMHVSPQGDRALGILTAHRSRGPVPGGARV